MRFRLIFSDKKKVFEGENVDFIITKFEPQIRASRIQEINEIEFSLIREKEEKVFLEYQIKIT